MKERIPHIAMPSSIAGGHKFSQVPQATIERSTIDRSCTHKTTFDAGYLIPFFTDEVLPGDTFKVNANLFARLTTPIKPLMDNMYMDTHFFFVPTRLLWANWQKFNGEQDNPGDSTSFTVPVFTAFTPAVGSLSDYLGMPTYNGMGTITPISLYHRAYALIYNKWYRDENLINSVPFSTGDGPDAIANYTLQRRGKRHDYFTSCLPSPQKGTAVALPIGTSAPIIPATTTSTPLFKGATSAHVSTKMTAAAAANPTAMQVDDGGAGNWTAGETLYWNTSGLLADLSNATAGNVNQFRQAFQIQKLLERDARGGTRYTEILKAHFGVTSPDARLQRPEYLGGGSSPLIISPIANNQSTPIAGGGVGTPSTPQANLSGIGTVSAIGHGFTKSFTEHGIIMGIVSTRADLTYQQGLERRFSRSTRYDYYWPALAHIGEQAVLNQELYVIGSGNPTDTAAFGYQERYGEYRYKPSLITGKFRSNLAGGASLDIWHLSQQLSAPALNQNFIEENPPMSRVVAVTTEPHFYFDSFINVICARPMPMYGVPGMTDHF